MEIQDEKRYLERVSPEEKLYKFIPLKHILTMFNTGNIRVSNIMQWEDVYENFFLKQNFFLDGKPLNVEEVANNNFCMSWTTCRESDAMWRIYSKCGSDYEGLDNVGIRVEASAKQLLRTFWGRIYEAPAYVKAVSYLGQNEIESGLMDRRVYDFHDMAISSLNVKREEFRHELEVRLIISVGTDKLREKKSYVDMPFGPLALF